MLRGLIRLLRGPGSPEFEALTVREIARLEVKPADTIVFQVDRALSRNERAHLEEVTERLWPGQPALFCHSGVRLQAVVSKEADAGDDQRKVISRGYSVEKPGDWQRDHYICVQRGARGDKVRYHTDAAFDGYQVGDPFPRKGSA